MSQAPQFDQSTGAERTLYVALELSAKSWVVVSGAEVGTRLRRQTLVAGDRVGLRRELARARTRSGLPPTAPVVSCYEAGRDGFWVHRLLTAEGVTNRVVDSSSIEVSRRARRAKTDRLDAEHLWRLLWRYEHGERQVWHVVHVPPPEVEDSRHQERLITTLTQEVTRWRNRLHALLATTGVRLRLVGDVPAQLAAARTWEGQPLPPGLQARARQCWAAVTALTTALAAARQQQRAAVRAAQARLAAQTAVPGEGQPAPRPLEALAAQIMQLQGVGIRTAMVLAKEVLARDLQNRRQVGALSGLTPTPYASGETHHEQGISRAGLARVRGLLVELAWQWVRRQPDSALTAWFLTRFGSAGRRPRKVGIVALARRLLIALWRYSRFGEVPAGAVLRAA